MCSNWETNSKHPGIQGYQDSRAMGSIARDRCAARWPASKMVYALLPFTCFFEVTFSLTKIKKRAISKFYNQMEEDVSLFRMIIVCWVKQRMDFLWAWWNQDPLVSDRDGQMRQSTGRQHNSNNISILG